MEGVLTKFSNRLKELLGEAELNSAQLANELGLDASTIQKLTRGTSLPYLRTLVLLANRFRCTTDYLLGLTDNLENVEPTESVPFAQQFKFLLQHFGVSRYRLQKDVGFAERALARWYAGEAEPNAESIVRLAKYFDCTTDFVIGREN